MSWQEQILDVVNDIEKNTETPDNQAAYHFVLLLRGYARELKAIVKAYGEHVRSVKDGPDGVLILSNPIIDRAKKQAEEDVKEARKTLRQEENVTSLGALVVLEGGPDDGTLVAAPPSSVPVGAKTNFGNHIYQVTESRGLLYVGEMEK